MTDPTAGPAAIQAVWAGRQPYLETWALQQALASARRDGAVPDLLLLLEHPPTYTIGRGGSRSNLFLDDAALAAVGATCHAIDRGGDITFHGPGQLVAYAIVDLGGAERSVRRYVEQLERTVIQTLADFEVAGAIDPAYPGVWVGVEKIAALGIAVRRRVAYHGFALNVEPDLRYFDYMFPCGIRDRGVTSLGRRLGRAVTIDEVLPRLTAAFGAAFAREVRWDLTWEDLTDLAGPRADDAAGTAGSAETTSAVRR
ncbi:MAG TPA: lipoyl(octanoyl) transferase LipB [Thermomicrobiaceae bacterium]|nr:lipoyl(octanoyl) transferase LipB [Thermomicrobiaceae bacterium]